MWKSIFLIALMAVCLGGSGDTKSKSTDSDWGVTVDGLRVKLTSDKSSYAPMEAILYRVELQNVGQNEAIISNFEEGLDEYSVELIFSNGKSVPLTLWGKREIEGPNEGGGPGATLKKGETKVVEGKNLTRAFDMSLDGRYTIVFHRRVLSPIDTSKLIVLTSNSVTILVGSEPPKQDREAKRSPATQTGK
jgi:hypothetical protein